MKLLSEALGEALALVDKATPGAFVVKFTTNIMAGDGLAATSVQSNISGHDPERNEKNADALVAAVNLLRQHGPAIAAVLRAVEGAGVRIVCEMRADNGVPCTVVSAQGHANGQRVALVPLDAAGSAEGVG